MSRKIDSQRRITKVYQSQLSERHQRATRSKRKPLNTTSRLAPMSANTAIHMLACPNTASTRNISLALGIKAAFLLLAVFGHASMWMAVFADMGASLLVVANGLRLLYRCI